MKKPKWSVYFRTNTYFQWKPSFYFNKHAMHKIKHGSVRVEMIPELLFSWLWWEIDFLNGSEKEWEWYFHVMELNGGDIEAAKKNYPWGKNDGNGEWIRTKIWEELKK